MTDYDAGEEQGVAKRKNKAGLVRQRETEDLRKVLATKEGRATLWRVLEECSPFLLSFAGENTHTTAFHEGRRSVGNWLWNEVFTSDEEAGNLMRREANLRDQKGKD